MVGFIADYESGEIKLQKDELSAGAFYSKENMPETDSEATEEKVLLICS